MRRSARAWTRALLGAASALASASCGPVDAGPARLSEWGIFLDGPTQRVADDVVPYAINAPLFSDYAVKRRYLRLPPGGRVTVREDGRWEFPVGAVLVKTFAFPLDLRDPSLGERVVETRLLVREEDGWAPYVYVWDEAVEDATLAQSGRRVPITFTDLHGETRALTYRVPTAVQCGNCHGGTGEITPIGPRTEQMDHLFDYGAGLENQLDHLEALGAFDVPPPPAEERAPLPDPFDASVALDLRARAYLDANCAHCHREGGAASQSGLWLGAHEPFGVRVGECKPPAAAGRGTGGRAAVVWPGDADRSILAFRVESDEPGVKMPELPTVLVHEEGAALLRAWIDAMPPVDCSAR